MAGCNISLVVFCSLLAVTVVVAVDQTRQPGAVGASVVEAVINLIRENCLFAEDKRFLRRLAYVQSRDGSDPKTYRPNYHGGIWQVDEAKFNQTRYSSRLNNEYTVIRNKFGIDWNNVRWEDLRKPLYSGIAASLYTKLMGSIGWRIENQAEFYQQYFLPAAGNNFTSMANLLDLGCHGNEKLDLVFVIDSSNSLSQDDFLRTLYFMDEAVDAFNISRSQTRVAVITYANDARAEFYLNQYLTKGSVKQAINNLSFKSGSTNTADAIQKSVNEVFSTSHGSRPDAVKVMIVVTDGVSDDRINTMHAADLAKNNGIVLFSVGVGSHVNSNELNTIATSPDCTHVFTVSNYTEIKAIKEEIQKSSCQAPVYIHYNVTYTCVIEECPPMALVTSFGGATLESNMTCGLGNVYTAFSNPYPGESFYEVVKQTSHENPGVLYRNSTKDQTLYINVVDALKGTTGSRGCIVHITPKKGDHTDHSVKCYLDGVRIKCPSDCKEKWNFPNPCTAANIQNGKTRFPHPTDPTKYLDCDKTGHMYIVQCPQNMSYYQECLQCVGSDTSCLSGKNPLNQSLSNPCTVSALLAGHFFFKYAPDETKFIHCDVWGKPWLLSCPAGEVWDHPDLTCVRKSAYSSPCRNLGPSGPFFYPHPCDHSKYIQCDDHGQEFIRPCDFPHYVFNPNIQKCESRLHYSAPPIAPGTICPDGSVYAGVSGTIQIQHSTLPVPVATDGSSGYTCCNTCQVYTSPCTASNIGANKMLFPIAGDRHHYIQCDLLGHMFCPMPCTPNQNGALDYFDPITSTCVDGSLTIDNIVG